MEYEHGNPTSVKEHLNFLFQLQPSYDAICRNAMPGTFTPTPQQWAAAVSAAPQLLGM